MRLVFVHGRAQGAREAADVMAEWRAALDVGLAAAGAVLPETVEVELPFYGKTLDDLVVAATAPLVEDVILRGAEQDEGEPELRGELIEELARASGITDAQILVEYEALGGSVIERGPLNWRWVQAMLKAMDRTPLGSMAVDTFTRDVYVYLTLPAVRRQVDALVAAALADGPTVVVAHSLGSVVAYNVLRTIRAAVEVRCLVTLGSPLAVRAIKQRLASPLAMPPTVKRWYNAMDEADVVPLYPLVAPHFAIRPPIENKTTVTNRTPNRHGISGYLDDVDVARVIHAALTA